MEAVWRCKPPPWKNIARLGHEVDLPEYDPNALPNTQSAKEALIKLPAFPNADREILDQYIRAFEKVIASAGDILEQYHPLSD